MMFTRKTRDILGFINEYGFITIEICHKLFYKNNKDGYNDARKKLRKLLLDPLAELEAIRDMTTNELIYQPKGRSAKAIRVSWHKRTVLRVLANISALSGGIDYFKIEQSWLGGSYKNDCHLIYLKEVKGSDVPLKCGLLVEFEKYHTTSVKKINAIYNSGEVQTWYKKEYGVEGYFPKLLLIAPNGTSKCISTDGSWDREVVDYSLKELPSIIQN